MLGDDKEKFVLMYLCRVLSAHNYQNWMENMCVFITVFFNSIYFGFTNSLDERNIFNKISKNFN